MTSKSLSFIHRFRSNQRETIFLISLILLYCFVLFRGSFVDEIDNWVGGLMLSRGIVIYRDFFSHHGPLMYFISAIPALLAPKILIVYRLTLFAIYLTGYTIIRRLTAKKLHSVLNLMYLIMVILSPVFHTQLLLGETVVSLSLVIYLFILYSHWRYNRPNQKTLLHVFFICSWFIFFAVPTFAPSILVLVTFTVLTFLRKPIKNVKNFRSNLVVDTFIWLSFPLYFLLTGSFQDFFWSVFTFNTQYYYPTRFGIQPGNLLINLINQPFIYFTNALSNSFTLHLRLLQTLKSNFVILINSHNVNQTIQLTKVALFWWFDRFADPELLIMNLLAVGLFSFLIIGLRKIKHRQFSQIKLTSVWLIFLALLLATLRIRHTELFHLTPFYVVSLWSVLIITHELVQQQYKRLATFLALCLIAFLSYFIKPYLQLINSANNLIPNRVLSQSHTLTNLAKQTNSTELINLTGDMSYYLTTNLQPVSQLLFYQPWFHAAPQLRSSMVFFLTHAQPNTLLLVDKPKLYIFAPELILIINTHFIQINQNTYIAN